MAVMLCRILASLLAMLPLATSQFTSPPARAVLITGEKVNVSYTTDLKNYTIALWQRAENGSRPRLGSIVYATADGPSSSFTWSVQTYDLDLKASPTFFFWLFAGNASHQGIDTRQLSSSYFNISDTSGASSSVSAAESSPTSMPSLSPALGSLPPDPPDAGGLSAAARAGIGAAVSVFCLMVAALLLLLFRHGAGKRPPPGDEAVESNGATATDDTNSLAELQSECVSPPPMAKLRVYQPVPGDTAVHPPPLAELPA